MVGKGKINSLKEDILEVLNASTDAPDVNTIIDRVRTLRVNKTLKALETLGMVEFDLKAQGWRVTNRISNPYPSCIHHGHQKSILKKGGSDDKR